MFPVLIYLLILNLTKKLTKKKKKTKKKHYLRDGVFLDNISVFFVRFMNNSNICSDSFQYLIH